MYRFTLLALSLLICCFKFSFAQILPAEGDTVNYRLAGFSVAQHPKAHYYLLEVADGINNNEVYFKKNIIISKTESDNRIIATVPEFGKSYTWRITYLNKKNKQIGKTPLFHFTTGTYSFIDTSKFRVRVLTNKGRYNDILLFFDNTRSLRDMNGNALWYLPDIPVKMTENLTIRDLKLTPQGTITFLLGARVFEVDYNGKILWEAPNDGKVSHDTTEYYHHEFTRLQNGNYMVAGHRFVIRQIPDTVDSNAYLGQWNVEKRNGVYHHRVHFGTVIEYNPEGEVVWSWSSSDAFTNEELFRRRIQGKIMTNTHMNGFYFDEEKKVVYTSYRDANRVVKTEYPSGKILAIYGKMPGSNVPQGKLPFSMQHDCRINSDGNLTLFNNNRPMRGSGINPDSSISFINIFREPINGTGELTKIWEFPCNIDTFAQYSSGAGGSVYELKDKNMLVSMGTANRDFIVTMNKEILWNVITEMKFEDKRWVPHDNYKISPIESPDLLELLVFNQFIKQTIK